MKKPILFLVLLPLFTFSQNWHPFPENQTSFFKKTTNSKVLQVIKIDSIKETENGNIYFNRRTPLHVETTEDYELYDPYQSWIGYSTLLDDNKAIFQNKNAQPISIYLNTDILESWLFYTFESGEYIEAWVETVDNINILEDLIDEVKIINFQAYNSAGNTIDNPINSDSLILSKNYGLIRTYKWLNFPQLTTYQLWGIEDLEATHGEPYDLDELSKGYNVGDEIHLYYNSQYQKIDEYVGKRLTETEVEYDIKTTSPNYGTISYKTKKYKFGYLPGESKFDENGVFLGFKSIKVSSEEFQGKHKYTIASYSDFEWVEYEGNFYWGREWSSSLGSAPFKICNSFHYYDNICNGDGDCWDMVYVNNTNGEWGEPLEFRVKDYQTIRPDFDVYFNNSKAIRIDTILNLGYGETRYYSYNTLEQFTNDDEYIYYDPYSSWIGKYIRIMEDGRNIFMTKNAEEIYFNTTALLNDEWDFFNLNEGAVIKAKIESIEYQMVLNDLYDSIKLISFQTYDSSGIEISHALNEAMFRLSKNYGLLDMPEIYNFNGNYRSVRGIASNNFEAGIINRHKQILSSLEEGDQFHYHWGSEDYFYNIKREIISKEIQGHKIQYVFGKCTNTLGYGYDTTNFIESTLDTAVFPYHLMPNQVLHDTIDFGAPFTFQISNEGETAFCDTLDHFRYKYMSRNQPIEYNGKLVWRVEIEFGGHFSKTPRWTKDLGWYYSDRGNYSTADSPDYLLNEFEECGSPHDFICFDSSTYQQDYQAIRPELKTYYRVFNGIYGIRIDSMEVHNHYIRYYNYPSTQRYEYAEGEYYTDPHASWLGIYVDVFGNGDNVFYDQDEIPFRIKTKADIGETWLASEHSWGSINASIISKEYHEILPDLYDSVKWLRLTYNNQELDLRLSKHYGLIDFPEFYRFYLHSPIPSIVGIENEEELIGTNFSMNEIINSLEVGDETHYRNTAYYGSFFKRKVMDKILTEKKVSYIYDACGQINETHPIDTTYYTNWADTVAFPIHIMPNEIVMDTSTFGSEFKMEIGIKSDDYSCTDVDGFRFSCYVKNDEFEVDGRVFWHMIPYDHFSANTVHVFAEGIGNYIGPKSDSDADCDVIDYYNNIAFSCGEAYEISCENTGFEEVINSKVSISPNPSNGIFNIHSSKKIEELRVYHLNGQIVSQLKELKENQIDLTSLPVGSYILELKTTDQLLIHQKVMINK